MKDNIPPSDTLGVDTPGNQRCSALTNAGNPCRSRAMSNSEFCLFHAEDRWEIARRGGERSAARRSVRDRFREDAEVHYDKLIDSLLAAVGAEVTRWGDCPECKHRVPVTFPDIRARTQAIQVLLDQGYGRPAATLQIQPLEEGLARSLRDLSDEELERRYRDALLRKEEEDSTP